MSDIAIRVEHLSKCYRIGLKEQRHETLTDTLAAWMRSPLDNFRRLQRLSRFDANEEAEDLIWALRDVSFEVRRGEIVGVIGRNGAGKSTLLKILSRITEPTSGRAIIDGRVASLLEVGTGFHPELTGRENVYLNGTVLGMTKREVDSRFDEIVHFSGVAKFIDTPVKRYSSGMKVRLAFSVAAHLEPEVLLVDEVLSVGDAEFQEKCLGKMEEVSSQGRTVLFVSHNLAAVQMLCQRGLLIADSTIVQDDQVDAVIRSYLSSLERTTVSNLLDRADRKGRGNIRLKRVEVLSADQAGGSNRLATGRPAQFVFELTDAGPLTSCGFTIYSQQGQPIAHFNSRYRNKEDLQDSGESNRLYCVIDELLLVPGRYRINVAVSQGGLLEDHLEAAAFFDVSEGMLRGRPDAASATVHLPHRWRRPAAVR